MSIHSSASIMSPFMLIQVLDRDPLLFLRLEPGAFQRGVSRDFCYRLRGVKKLLVLVWVGRLVFFTRVGFFGGFGGSNTGEFSASWKSSSAGFSSLQDSTKSWNSLFLKEVSLSLTHMIGLASSMTSCGRSLMSIYFSLTATSPQGSAGSIH